MTSNWAGLTKKTHQTMSQETPTADTAALIIWLSVLYCYRGHIIMLIYTKKQERKHSSKASRMSHKIRHSPRGPRTPLCSICEMPKVSASAFLRWSRFVEFHSLTKAVCEVALWASRPPWEVHRGAGMNSSPSGWSGSSLLAGCSHWGEGRG